MEAGRLAAEYLVAKGVLPPGSLQRRGSGWVQLPPPPTLPPAQETPAFYDGRNGRRRFDDGDGNTNPRSRWNRSGESNDNDSSSYNGRGKRKFGNYNRYSDWGRDKGRSRGHSDSRSHDDGDDDGPPGYRRERRGSGRFDDAGNGMSWVAASRTEATGESELEDTGSKVSSSSNFRKSADALQEVDGENEANKMHVDSNPSNSEVVEQGINGENTSNNASSVVEEAESKTKHLPVPLDDKASDEKPDDSSVSNKKIEDDGTLAGKVEASDEKVPGAENNLLNFCSFANVPTKRRSILARRNAAPAHRGVAVAEQIDLVSSEDETHMATDVAGHGSSLANVPEGNKDNPVCLEHMDTSTTCNQMVDPVKFQAEETQIATDDSRGHKNIEQHHAVCEAKEHNEIPPMTSRQNSLKQQVEEGMQIYNVDTPPQDEDLIASADKEKVAGVALLPSIKVEAIVTKEEEKLGQSSSFKICDLNLVGSPDVSELRNDPGLGHFSIAGCSMEPQNQQQVDFRTTTGNSTSDTNMCAQVPLDNKVVQVIDIEDGSPFEDGTCDTLKTKSETYASEENMMNPDMSTDAIPDIQDGYNLAISDYLGADISCYQSMQTDLHNGMSLNDSEGPAVMDDSIYGSLSDIGFMEVWDQPPQDQDYEKFF
uniref:Uncharacterized protein n=1 Tax=Oryza brachyantha TaxID=4533 RepID=J3LXZ0_ORYBR